MASPPFDPNEAVPSDGDIVSQFPAAERTFRDEIESWLELVSDPDYGYVKIPVGTTVGLDSIANAPLGAIQFDTTLDVLRVLKAEGPSVWDPISFPSGTRLPFYSTTTPPPGWTKVTDAEFEDAIAINTTDVSGTGGAVGYFDYVLDADHLPATNISITGTTSTDGTHGHPFRIEQSGGQDSDNSGGFMVSDANDATANAFSGTVSATLGEQIGGAGSHSHTVSGTGSIASDEEPLFDGVKYVAFILCEKD